MARTDPRDARAIAERELELNTLQPGEHVYRMVSVFKRPAISYFRATRGILVLTNKRLLYLGLEPRDLLAAPDLPPTFEERDFPIDTMVNVSAGRTFFGLAKAIVIETPNEKLRLGVPSGAWPKADIMIVAMDVRRDKAIVASARAATVPRQGRSAAQGGRGGRVERRSTTRYAAATRSAASRRCGTRRPTGCATWNKLPDNRIRVGQVLLVRPAFSYASRRRRAPRASNTTRRHERLGFV